MPIPRSSKNIHSVEDAILAAKKKKIYPKALLQKIIDNECYLVCDDHVLRAKELMLPLCVEMNSKKYVCAFTNKEWADEYLNETSAIVKLSAIETLRNIPQDYGIIINPNHDASVKFEYSGIQNILRDFG